MKNFLTFDEEDVREGEGAVNIDNQHGFMSPCFSFSTGKQSNGPNFQENSKSFTSNFGFPDDSAYFADSKEISNFVLDFGLYCFENQKQTPKRDEAETSIKENLKIGIVNLSLSTQTGTTQGGTAPSSHLAHPTWSNHFNSSIEVEPKVEMNFPVMEIEGAIQRVGLNDAQSSEEKKQPEVNAERDNDSSHSMQEEEDEEEIETDRKEEKRYVKPASNKRNLPSLFMVAVKKAYQYYRTPQRDKRKYELQSIKRVIDDDGKVDEKTKKQLDTFIEGCNATLKTYKTCKLFINESNNRRVKGLFKKFVLRIFEHENEKWLRASGTKNEQFLKELEAFSKAFSKHVFGPPAREK